MIVRRAGAAGARRLDEVERADLRRRGLGDAADRRDEHQGQRQHAVGHAAAHRAGDRHRQQHRRKRVEHVHRAHDRGIDAAADKTADDAEHAADQRGNHDRHDAHQQRYAPAIDQPAQHVAAEFVGAEQVAAPAERFQPPDNALLVRIERRDQRRKNRRQHDQQHDRGESQGHRVVTQPVEHRLPIAAHPRRRRRLLLEDVERVGPCDSQCRTSQDSLPEAQRAAGCAGRSATAADRRPGWSRRTPATAPGSCPAIPARRD